MPNGIASRSTCQVQSYRQQLQRSADFPITRLLPVAVVDEALAAEGCCWRERFFTPVITLWIFLGQVLDPDPSCQQAVFRFVAWLSAHGRALCSSLTGAYCRARQRLVEGVLARLVRRTGADVETTSPHEWHWHGRRVRICDGTTVSMPATPANQRAYPHSRTQFSPYKGKETGETALLRSLLTSGLTRGDLLLADRGFANYWVIALARALGIDVLFRQHQLRKVDFRRGQRLGKDDHLITWAKPQRPAWMTKTLYATLPATLTLREVRLRIPKGKKRTKEIVVVSTLLDAGRYAKGELQTLYRLRWQAELHLRSLKTILQMDILRCKTPAMVRKEIWAHFLVYNLIRSAMAQAAVNHQKKPWQISFTGSLQALRAFGGFWPVARPVDPDVSYDDFLRALAEHRVGHRPDRLEPRARKRRPKHYPLLNEPRHQAKARLARNGGR